MNISKKDIFVQIKQYAIITVALFVMAFGWSGFLIPNDMLGGGVSGMATILYWATKFPIGITVLAINIILVLLGMKIVGSGFGIKTVYSIFVYSLFLSLLQGFITEPLITDKFLAAIIGGGMAGLSIGVAFTQGGSTGGTDIIAMIINKYRNISPGRIILVLDVVIITSSYFVVKNIESLIYSYVIMAICSYSIDLVLTGTKQSVQLFIFSAKTEEIADKIGNEMHRGVTFIKGRGWYTKQDVDILMVVARKQESQSIFRIIKEIDPKAFMTMNTVMGAYGKGFERIKNNKSLFWKRDAAR
jgi:Uncharacterized conserved protein